MRPHGAGRAGTLEDVRIVGLVILLVVASTAAACTTSVTGSPVGTGSVVTKHDPNTPGVDPSFVHDTDGSEIDRLAATVVTDVMDYWRQNFPATFGTEWKDLTGGFYSVDTARAKSEAPPCARRSIDVEGNAFYCPTEDVIAWDRSALLPVLRDRFGEASVMLVLAHEMGHAVQRRAGLTVAEQRSNPDKYPTILVEAQADCYAGSFVRWVADGKAAHLQVGKDRLDSALESLITFRDPIGTDQGDKGAHGDAFDRVSAFQDGYDQGLKLCADMSVANRKFTLRGFTDAGDAERGGNLPFDQLVKSMTEDLNSFFNTTVTQAGKRWTNLTPQTGEANVDCAGNDQGPIAFCPSPAGGGEVKVAKDKLADLHSEIGDYATGTILASRFGLAAVSALGKPLDGADAQRQVLCLAGAYTGQLITRTSGFFLSPGDLDEAVQVLLQYDYAGRDGAGKAIGAGYERVSVFRSGAVGGAPACSVS
ncbi:neutral zinc metallopeptidase [Actinophytocola sp.]|uniref:neutral zinc metallopeptidase n=1 Tax=Actinophytocola sp. TaxID=1872138 RepID=UPI002D8015E3|nr:neutral zinc metallopeptidase [Actinophytocola sp.]HET9143673.1 neutral zinc metallopeptidase [Actinophytocola sp.]